MLLERFPELPMVVFTARYNKVMNGGSSSTPIMVTQSISKYTGKRLMKEDATTSGYAPRSSGGFYALAIDRRAGTYDLIANHLRLRHYFADACLEIGAKR